jgi:hypothetical protein
MDAEFYCRNVHLSAAGELVRSLTKLVDPTIALKVMNLDTASSVDRMEAGRRYTKLLHASIPPERELGIEAVTGLELFGSRVYIRIYWPMLVEGDYSYPGENRVVRRLYWTTYERNFHKGMGLEQFLPALALRERMVLVPKGQNATLAGMGPNEPPRPPLQRGVLEVDFDDPAEMEQAFLVVGKELRRELRHELLAYQSFQQSDRPDIDTASAYLGVSPSLLTRALREESDSRERIYKQLRCKLEPTTIVKDRQTRMTLWIDNPSGIDLGELRVQVRGPRSGLEVNPERANIHLPAEASSRTDFSLAATREGDFVLEVLFLDLDAEVPREMLPVQQLWITSIPASS